MPTVRWPFWPLAVKLPLSATSRCTVMPAPGAGTAVSVNVASPPSVTSAPAAMRISGGSSSSRTTTVASPSVAEGA